MDVCRECCVLSGRGLCDELITRPEESYRLVHRCVWSRNLVIVETLSHWGVEGVGMSLQKQILPIPRNVLKMQQRRYVLFGLVISKPSVSVVFTQCRIFSLPFSTVRHLLRHKEKTKSIVAIDCSWSLRFAAFSKALCSCCFLFKKKTVTSNHR